ncbi:MAG: hypothetical protein IKK93_01000 [Campylobacter sp.]|nr:hypothetical protein [Campylobacter sp.]
MEKEYVYLEIIFKDGHKEYSEHTDYFSKSEPSHRCIIENIRSAKTKRTRWLKINHNSEVVDVKIKKAIVKFTDIEVN